MIEVSPTVAFTVVAAMITYAITSVLFIIREAGKVKAEALVEVAKVRSDLQANITHACTEIEKLSERHEAFKEKIVSDLRAQAEIESRARHKIAGDAQSSLAAQNTQHRADMKEFGDRLDRMARETVRKEDMTHLESRMTIVLDKLEGKIEAGMTRLEQKIDAIRNPLSGNVHRREGA